MIAGPSQISALLNQLFLEPPTKMAQLIINRMGNRRGGGGSSEKISQCVAFRRGWSGTMVGSKEGTLQGPKKQFLVLCGSAISSNKNALPGCKATNEEKSFQCLGSIKFLPVLLRKAEAH